MADKREILLHLNTPLYPEKRPWLPAGTETLYTTDVLEPRTYLRAMMREMRAAMPDYEADCELAAVWVGGLPCLGGMNCQGIAMHMADAALGEMLGLVKDSPMARSGRFPEVTLTAHPGKIAGNSIDILTLGRVSRVWIDLGTSNAKEAKRLERFMEHDLAKHKRELLGKHLAQGEVDLGAGLLLGIPGQTPETARESVETAVKFGATWLSIDFVDVEPDAEEHLDACANGMEEGLLANGFVEYLPGQWAIPGHESLFMQRLFEGSEYLGFGLGATSAIDGMGVSNTGDYEMYLKRPDDPAATVAQTWKL